MLGYLGVPERTVRVEVFEGKEMLPTYLTTLTLRPGFLDLVALGIVRDADEDASATVASVKFHLERNGLISPSAHGQVESGSCFDGRVRSVGIFIARDGVAPGALESLYLRAVGSGPLVACVRDFMRCVAPNTQHTLVAQLAKVEFHAWLATCPQPGILPGQAMDANYIDRDSPVFAPIRAFLQGLAEAAGQPDTPSS